MAFLIESIILSNLNTLFGVFRNIPYPFFNRSILLTSNRIKENYNLGQCQCQCSNRPIFGFSMSLHIAILYTCKQSLGKMVCNTCWNRLPKCGICHIINVTCHDFVWFCPNLMASIVLPKSCLAWLPQVTNKIILCSMWCILILLLMKSSMSYYPYQGDTTLQLDVSQHSIVDACNTGPHLNV